MVLRGNVIPSGPLCTKTSCEGVKIKTKVSQILVKGPLRWVGPSLGVPWSLCPRFLSRPFKVELGRGFQGIKRRGYKIGIRTTPGSPPYDVNFGNLGSSNSTKKKRPVDLKRIRQITHPPPPFSDKRFPYFLIFLFSPIPSHSY